MALGMLQESSDEVIDRCIMKKLQQEDLDIAWMTPTPEESDNSDEELSPEVAYYKNILDEIIDKANKVKETLRKENGIISLQVISSDLMEISNKFNDISSMLNLADCETDSQYDISDQNEIDVDDDDDYYDQSDNIQMLYGDITL